MGNRFGVDIGGTVARIVYFSPHNKGANIPKHEKEDADLLASIIDRYDVKNLSYDSEELGGNFHFLYFELRNIETFLTEFAGEVNKLHSQQFRGTGVCPVECVNATGGGSYKYEEFIREKFGIQMKHINEKKSVVRGVDFTIKNFKNEIFALTKHHNTGKPSSSSKPEGEEAPPQRPSKQMSMLPIEYLPFLDGPYPYLLVNFRSGVSFYRVSDVHTYERISGCGLGGGTFWGLCRLLTKFESFEEAVRASALGDNTKVDMLVGDIYGGDYSEMGLKADLIASSFGKGIWNKEDVDYNDNDIAAALLRMICYNAAQISYLVALRHRLPRIYLAGPVIESTKTMDMISFAIEFWSKGQMKAHFLAHAGWLGAIGALIENYDTGTENDQGVDLDLGDEDEEKCTIL